MNIFVLDKDPVKAARFHNDRHVIKMILESAQLLSTAHVVLDGEKVAAYDVPFLLRPTHVNHPCAIWARATGANYDWLYRLLVGLLAEYTRRYGKVHRYGQAPPWPAAGALVEAPAGALVTALAGAHGSGQAPAQRVSGESRTLPAVDSVAGQLAARPRALASGGRLQPWPQCMPALYKRAPANAVAAYRAYYFGEKQHIANWRAPATCPPWWDRRQERENVRA